MHRALINPYKNTSRFKRKYLFTAIALCICLLSRAQPMLMGSTYSGGNEFGLIFQTNLQGNNLKTSHAFEGYSGTFPFYTALCEAGNGKLYGLCSQGGNYAHGVLFEFDPATNAYTKLIDFDGDSLGSNPRGALMRSAGGKLYGMTNQGGANNLGVLFEFDPVNKTLQKKFDFDGSSRGRNPFGSLIQAANGRLYGLTYQGGAYNEGVLFEFNPANDSFKRKFDFNGNTDGRNPFGSLMQASNGHLYGMTYQGGTSNAGILFEFRLNSDSLRICAEFDGSNKGSNPYGALTESGNGRLFGMTFLGGSTNSGVLFEFNTGNDSFTRKLNFDGSAYGRNPYGNLLRASNGRLYGMAYQGGASNGGILFEFNPANDSFLKKKDFSGSADGRNPFGSLMQATDGYLYGCTYRGGSNNAGVLFQFATGNAGFVKKVDLNAAVNGKQAFGNLLQTDNYKVYGMTNAGGSNDLGVLFEYDAENKTYSKKADFSSSSGSKPYGSLTRAGNGKLYGMTSTGGAYDYGVLFEYNPINNSYTRKLDFDGNNGRNPYSAMTFANDTILYGMTPNGGLYDFGVLFSYAPLSGAYTALFHFDDTGNGSSPFGKPVMAANGKLYGLTYQGGLYGYGTLYAFDPADNTLQVKKHFDGAVSGSFPQGSLLLAGNGKCYGMTQYGGNQNMGLIFEFDPASDGFRSLLHFDGSNGKNPVADLLEASAGKLFGMTPKGGSADAGVLFEYSISDSSFTLKNTFDVANGSSPFGSLSKVCLPSRVRMALSSCDSLLAPSGRYTWYSSGTYSDTISTLAGCDSILTIELKILRRSFSSLIASACSSWTAPDGKTYDSSGTYQARIANAAGCDSIISIQLRIKNTQSAFAISACQNYTAPDGSFHDTSGNILVVIPNVAGCDSSIRIRLKLNKSGSDFDTSVCRHYVAPDGQRYNQSGTISAVIPNYLGCDSSIQIRLTVEQINDSVSASGATLTAWENGAAYQWLDCSNGFQPLTGDTGRVFTATKNGLYAVIITRKLCSDTSACTAVSSLNLSGMLLTGTAMIYPNPTDAVFDIVLPEMTAAADVDILDALGKSILRERHTDTERIRMRLESPAGIYTVVVRTTHKTYVYKLILNR